MSKKEDKELQRQKVRESLEQFPDDRQAQIQASGLKQSTFYNRLREVQAEERAA